RRKYREKSHALRAGKTAKGTLRVRGVRQSPPMNQNARPMDCERYDKIALNLLYEELDELTAAAARRHLHHCTRCKNISSSMQATKELAELPLVDPPEGLRDRI